MNESTPIPYEPPPTDCYAGLDWARDHHDLVVIDAQGRICTTLRFEHSQAGWTQCRSRLAPYGSLPIAVATNQGPAVEQLLALGARVYPVNPKSAQRYRERQAPSGVKNDQLDAWSLADALRLDVQTGGTGSSVSGQPASGPECEGSPIEPVAQ